MRNLVADIEADGLQINAVTTIHCIVAKDRNTKEVWRFSSQPSGLTIEDGILFLQENHIAGHNFLKYDIPGMQNLYPWFYPKGFVRDSLVEARVVWADVMKDRDFRALKKGRLPAEFKERGLIGSHSLKAWGYRTGEAKDDFDGPWDRWSQEMEDYCEQDVHANDALFDLIDGKDWPWFSLWMENKVAWIVARQERYGFLFDQPSAVELQADLSQRREELRAQLQEYFPPFYRPGKLFTPKADNKRYGYVKDAPLCKVNLVDFNPGSGQHIADRLQKVKGWKPKEWTPEGEPKTSEDILSSLDWPEAQLLTEYAVVDKRLGQLSEGQNAWLKKANPMTGRIHGGVNTNGAATGRMTHSGPNMAQVPANGAPYGERCRALFTVPAWKKLVGIDADGLELRGLGHFMATWDEGVFARAVVEGDKSEGTDAHTINQKAIGLYSRDSAKTVIYALIYGAGDYKLGLTILEDMPEERRKQFRAKKKIIQLGKTARAQLTENIPALGILIDRVQKRAKKRGYLYGLDGRKLYVRSMHSALNTLIQSAGGLIMKMGLVILDGYLQNEGLIPGDDYEFVVNVHDEWQIECRPEHAELVAELGSQAIRDSGWFFDFRCVLEGGSDIGQCWRDTH